MPKRDSLFIVCSLLSIFLFVTLDNVISPLIALLHPYYNIAPSQVLGLLSSCNFGIVLGSFLGPLLLDALGLFRFFGGSLVLFSLALSFFAYTSSFPLAILARFVMGITSGFFAATFWWVTYEGVSHPKAREVMTSVMLGGRPLGISLGVPLLVLGSYHLGWQLAFVTIGAIFLLVNLPFLKHLPSKTRVERKKNFFQDYLMLKEWPCFYSYYGSLFLTSAAYFGLYSISGPWFTTLFQQDTPFFSTLFLMLGISEMAISFLAPLFSKEKHFSWVMSCAVFLFALFSTGVFSLPLSIAIMVAFVISYRLFLFQFTKKLLDFFPDHPNKAVLGSLTTLISWFSFACISFIQSYALLYISLPTMAFCMLLLLLGGFFIGFRLWSKFHFKVLWQKTSYVKRYNRLYQLRKEDFDYWASLLKLNEQDVLVDFGPGQGFFLKAVASQVTKAIGVDSSEIQLEEKEALKRHQVELVKSDFLHFDWKGPKITKALARASLHHLTFEEKKLFFKRLAPMMAPNASFLLLDMAFEFDKNLIKNDFGHFKALKEEAQKHYGPLWKEKKNDIMGTWFLEFPEDIERWKEVFSEAQFVLKERVRINSFISFLLFEKKEDLI